MVGFLFVLVFMLFCMLNHSLAEEIQRKEVAFDGGPFTTVLVQLSSPDEDYSSINVTINGENFDHTATSPTDKFRLLPIINGSLEHPNLKLSTSELDINQVPFTIRVVYKGDTTMIDVYSITPVKATENLILTEDTHVITLWCWTTTPVSAKNTELKIEDTTWVHSNLLTGEDVADAQWVNVTPIPKKVDVNDGSQPHANGTNHTLSLEKVEHVSKKYSESWRWKEFSGLYGLRIRLTNGAVGYKVIPVEAVPHVHYPRPKPQYKLGEAVTIGCYIFGYPTPDAKWYRIDGEYSKNQIKKGEAESTSDFSEKEYSFEETIIGLKSQIGPGSVRAIYITINSIKGAYYQCEATNTRGTDSELKRINARWRFMFVYPLAGSFIQIIILILFIRFIQDDTEKGHKQLVEELNTTAIRIEMTNQEERDRFGSRSQTFKSLQ